MIQGVCDFYYSAYQVEKMKGFYVSVLGMTIKDENPHWISLDCGGVMIGLHTEPKPIPRVERNSHGAITGGTLTLASTDIKADRKKIEEFGCAILGETENPWGHLLAFEDPDGNVLKLKKG